MRKSKTNKRIPKASSSMPETGSQIPIDISKIGTSEDPCFGKLYEPITQECTECGDSELCSIVHMHTMGKLRTKLSKTQMFKDEVFTKNQTDDISTTELSDRIYKEVSANKLGLNFTKLVKTLELEYDSSKAMPPGRFKDLCKIAIKLNTKLKPKKENGKVNIRCTS
jgi:hypothetical protein